MSNIQLVYQKARIWRTPEGGLGAIRPGGQALVSERRAGVGAGPLPEVLCAHVNV